ncbi:hypothetical protein B7P43_G05121 [Cryptotermes secundus]|nr:hypothetical protein B7P43_G05121 [Cryptotermes secundus]
MEWDFFRDVSAENMQIYRDGGRCGYLHNSNYSFQVYTSEGAKLAFVFHPVSGVRAVKLNLIGGDCEINCDGSSSNCSMPLDSSAMKDFSKPQYFVDLKYRYYCIRVLHGACAIHTVTIKIEDPPPPPTPTASDESVQPGVILLTTGTIVAVVLVAVFVKRRYCDDPFRPEPVDTKEPEAASPWPSSPTLQKVLLLYSRDCPQFCEVARALGQLLQSFGNLKVLDPLQQNEMEQVSENISGWLTQHLQSPDVKLVIVVSEGAMVRQNALLNNQLVHNDEPHFLDPVFTLALQQMHERPQLGNDYKRIFPVRFEDFTPSEVSLSLIVPLKCYVLQRHLGKIIAELGQCNSAPEAGYEDIRRICPQEVSQLESAIRDMKSYCDDNPHYLKDHFSVVSR